MALMSYVEPKFSTFDMLFLLPTLVISDYSCIVYEAAFLGIPVYFYNFDMDKYLKERGLAIDYYKEIPGPAKRRSLRPDERRSFTEIRHGTVEGIFRKYYKIQRPRWKGYVPAIYFLLCKFSGAGTLAVLACQG